MIHLFRNSKTILTELRRSGEKGISLRLRLLAFLSVLVITIVLAFLMVLMIIGVFSNGRSESRKLIENELLDLNKEVYADFGKLSRQGILLSEQLSHNISQILADHNLPYNEFQKHPELIETILDSQVDNLSLSLQTAKSSGIYILLDYTVNELAKGSEFSKAGLFLKSTEPNIMNSIEANIRYLKGPAAIARSRNIELLPQWEQEFNIKNYDFYEMVIQSSKEQGLPLSKLYYWSKRIAVSDSVESGMLLAVPMIAEDGTVYGICGFEISSMLFKLAYSPDNVVFPHIFATLSLIDEQTININNGLIAGNYYMTSHLTDRDMTIADDSRTFYNYTTKEGLMFSGIHQNISLYPSNSIYADNNWITGILMPKEELSAAINSKNKSIFGAVFLLFIVGMLMATIISFKYSNPITSALNGIKTNGYSSKNKTKIIEIDDLLEYLSEQDEKTSSPTSKTMSSLAHHTATFENFVKSIKTLSPAETTVFDLYSKGYTAKEITETLYLSINTIKTHNKRIYEKLNVSSRKELLIYFKMMEELASKKLTS
ncbi:MAG: LuxR C-terminal-related transcriptional regulator [Mobilitalea sp.]